MAHPYDILDPNGIGTYRKEGMARKSLGKEEKDLRRFVGQKTQDFTKAAYDIAARLHPELVRDRSRLKEFAELVRGYRDTLKEQQGIQGESVEEAFAGAVDAGATLKPDNLVATPEQQKLMQTNKPWKRTLDQAKLELLQESPDEERLAIFKGQLTKEQAQRLEKLQKEENYGAPEKKGGAVAAIARPITAMGRGAQATVASGIDEFRDIAESNREIPFSPVKPLYNPLEVLSSIAKIPEKVAPAIRGAAQAFTEKTGIEPMFDTKEPSYLRALLFATNPIARIGESVLQAAHSIPGGETRLGVPTEKAHEIVSNPVAVGEIASAALAGGAKGAFGKEGDISLARSLEGIKEDFKTQATRQAIQEIGDTKENRPAIVARAKELYAQKLQGDLGSLAIKHPNATQLAVEVATPEPAFSVAAQGVIGAAKLLGKGAGAASKAAQAVPFVQRATEAISKSRAIKAPSALYQGFRAGFTYMPWTYDLAKLGEKGEIAGARARMASEEALAGTQKFVDDLMSDARAMNKTIDDYSKAQVGKFALPFTDKWAAREKAKAWAKTMLVDAIESPNIIAQGLGRLKRLPPELKSAVEAGRRFQQHMEEFHTWGDTMKIWDQGTGQLIPKSLREFWMPHRVFEEKDPAIKVFEMLHPARATARAAGTYERKGAKIEMDPLKQYQAEIAQTAPKIQIGKQVQETHAAMLEKDIVLQISNPKAAQYAKEARHFEKQATSQLRSTLKLDRRMEIAKLQAQNLEARIAARKVGDLNSLQREFLRLQNRLKDATGRFGKDELAANEEKLRAKATRTPQRWDGGRAYQRMLITRNEIAVLNRDIRILSGVIDTVKKGGVSTRAIQNVSSLQKRHVATLAKHKALYEEKQAAIAKATAFDGLAAQSRVKQAFDSEIEKQATNEILKRQTETGVEHVKLETDTFNILQRIVGKTGEKQDTLALRLGQEFVEPATVKGEEILIVPKPYADFLGTILPVIANKNPAEAKTAMAKAISMFHSGFVQPYQRSWRSLVTIPIPLFHAKNIVGGFALSTIAHGVGALNPELQAKAAAAAFAAAHGSKKALALTNGISWTLRDGERTTLGEVIRSAQKIGLTSQLAQHLAQGELRLPGTTGLRRVPEFINRAMNFDLPFLRKADFLSPGFAARVGENYQHLVAYMGFLDNLSKDGIAKAADLTAKFSGNYNRLGTFEKSFMREAFGFYAWMRFVFPHVVRQVYENPTRMAAWMKGRGYFERERGDEVPVSHWGMPKWAAGLAMAGPVSLQQIQPGSHQFAISVMEDPWNMGFAFWPLVSKTLGVESTGENLAMYLGPLLQMTTEVIGGTDLRTGEKIDRDWIALNSTRAFGSSRLGQAIFGMPERLTKAGQDLISLYSGRPEEKSLALRFAVGRSFLGLDNYVAELLGEEGRSLGGMLDPEHGGTLGQSHYLSNPFVEGAPKKGDAVERFKNRERHLERALPGGR